MMRFAVFLFLISSASVVYATDYYVGGPGASDNNPGTSSQPFATIQKAASIANSGDVVIIRGGTYRETITPANNGVTFQSTEGAVVSGLNAVTSGWTVHSGNIYKTTLNLGPMFTEHMTGFNNNNLQYNNTQLLAQQIFDDGEMQMLASFPKVSSAEQLLERRSFRSVVNAPNFGPTAITDAGFAPFGNLTGGIVTIQGWFIIHTRTITGHNGNTINYNTTGDGGDHAFSKFYRVSGKLGLLTQEKEWHYENNTLYFWQKGGGIPTGVEYKARNWGFDLRNRSNITILGLHFIGCDPAMTTTSSANIIIDNIRAKYTNHHLLETKGGADGYNDSPVQTGLKLLGPGSVLRNSEFNYSSAVAVWAGSNVTIQNNKFENGGYGGFYGAFIKLAWNGLTGANNVKILNNTFTRSGRGAIELTANQAGTAYSNVEIAYNDFSKFIMVNVDGGAIYGARKTILNNSRIHHNWFHNDGGFDEAGTGQQRGIQVNGVYWDQASGPATIDHNVHWNGISGSGRSGGYSSEFYTQIYWHESHQYATAPCNLYNNTFATATGGGQYSYVTYTKSPHDVQRNNISRAGLVIDWGINGNVGNVANALLSGVQPQFVGSGEGGLAYRLNNGSPAINAGTVINGITDGSVGAPDIGAYEYGGEGWVAGYKAVPQTSNPNISPKISLTAPAANANFTQGAAINITATASDDDGTVARVEFFNGNTKIGEDLTSPYAFSWTGAPAGTHNLTARATDNRGATTTSTRVTITVTAAANQAPIVAITSPVSNASVTQGAAINVAATATDSDGTVAKVEFFNGTTKLGEDTSSPYSYTIASATVGTYALIARATDDKGAVTNSATVNVTVRAATNANRPPVVAISSPANSASFQSGTAMNIAATATDSDGTVAKVEFFNGTTKLGEDTSSPYSYTIASATVGTYALIARATDDKGAVTNSSTVNVTVTAAASANKLPVVAISSPANSSSFQSGAAINIAASATDSDGTVSKVEFFNGTTKLGEDTSSPYSFSWTNASVGAHTLTARATDNSGGVANSTAVNVVVTGSITVPNNNSPTIAITAPTNGSNSDSGDEVEFVATATDDDGTVTNVEFFEGTNKIGEVDSAPYSIVWTPTVPGNYSITAVATDNQGATTVSSAIEVTINGQSIVGGEATDVYGGIPRFFSPNGDGNGDTWVWSEDPRLKNASVEVRTLANELVYSSSAYDNTWDGRVDGKQLQEGQYFYIARLTDLTVLRASLRIIR